MSWAPTSITLFFLTTETMWLTLSCICCQSLPHHNGQCLAKLWTKISPPLRWFGWTFCHSNKNRNQHKEMVLVMVLSLWQNWLRGQSPLELFWVRKVGKLGSEIILQHGNSAMYNAAWNLEDQNTKRNRDNGSLDHDIWERNDEFFRTWGRGHLFYQHYVFLTRRCLYMYVTYIKWWMQITAE